MVAPPAADRRVHRVLQPGRPGELALAADSVTHRDRAQPSSGRGRGSARVEAQPLRTTLRRLDLRLQLVQSWCRVERPVDPGLPGGPGPRLRRETGLASGLVAWNVTLTFRDRPAEGVADRDRRLDREQLAGQAFLAVAGHVPEVLVGRLTGAEHVEGFLNVVDRPVGDLPAERVASICASMPSVQNCRRS